MVKLVSDKKTTLELLEGPMHPQDLRPYLGMSGLGHACNRLLWYSFRWAYKVEHSSRLMRLFKRGHREEVEIILELEKIGMEVEGEQEEMIAGFGHIKGHCDGKAINVPEAPKTEHVLEFKTMADKYFKEMRKKGVKLSKPVYYAQCQLYMHFLGLTRALFIAVNKNDDAYYVERIYYDESAAFALIARGEGIVLSETPPTRPFSNTWYECKFCDARDTCHFGYPMASNCRTCVEVSLGNEGSWYCGNDNKQLDDAAQLAGCSEYNPIDNT